jgi:hypothetical protein
MPYVAYADGNNNRRATVMKWDGDEWIQVGDGAGFSDGSIGHLSLDIDSNGIPYVAYTDDNGQATVMKYTDGGDTGWEPVGSPRFSDGEA